MTVKKETHPKKEQAEINIGMVGHVDHGKTSLTQALTGTWTDTHSEELKRGISIRLGYADATLYKCENCKGSSAYTNKAVCPICGKKAKKLRSVSFVDAPGHETLMTTMLSGAAIMQGAILVITANEKCPQPQTKEHLMALKIAGIENIVVAQNKIDLVEKKEALENMSKIKQFLEDDGYKNIPIIPIAAHFGTNIDMLIEAIEKKIPTPKFDLKKPFKMFCARSFDVNKPGTELSKIKGGVLGGSLIQGKIKIGDKIIISPGINGKKIETKIISLGAASGEITEANPGGLIAIGTMLDPSLAQNDKMRGQIIAKPGSIPEAKTEIEFEITYLKRELEKIESKIKINEPLVLSIGTLITVGNAIKLHQTKATIALKSAVVVEKNQRIAISKKREGKWRLVAYGTVG